MAESVHLFLKAKGKDIKGDSTHISLGRADSIECVFFEMSGSTAREAGSGMATGKRQYQPLFIRKRIDKSSPLLFKALCNNEVIEGVFKFFRPNPTGDGTTEHFYTISFKQGRISSFRTYVPDNLSQLTTDDPPLEEVSFVFNEITLTYTTGGVTHTDNLGAIR